MAIALLWVQTSNFLLLEGLKAFFHDRQICAFDILLDT